MSAWLAKKGGNGKQRAKHWVADRPGPFYISFLVNGLTRMQEGGKCGRAGRALFLGLRPASSGNHIVFDLKVNERGSH